MAISLMSRPRLLFLDEPTVGIDPQSRNHIFETVESLRDDGMTVLYTTHYMEEADRLCDRLGIMDNGRLIRLGSPHEIKSDIGRSRARHTGKRLPRADRQELEGLAVHSTSPSSS